MGEHGTGLEATAIKEAITAGQFVPVQVTVALLNKAIKDNLKMGNNLFVLDGFPRNSDNIREWQTQWGEYDIPMVLFLDAPQEVLSGRVPDASAVQSRMAYFNQNTFPLIKFFADSGKLQSISAVATPEQVYEQVRQVVRANIQ